MTLFTQFDLMTRGASIALFVLWSWILLRDHRDMLAVRIAVAMNVAIIGYVLATTSLTRLPNTFWLIFSVLAGAAPGLFWLFARTWFNDKQQLERWALLLVLLSVANVISMQFSFERYKSVNDISVIIFRMGMLGFAAAGLWEAWRGRDGDLVEARRQMRPKIVLALGVYVILITIAEIAVYNFGAPMWFARSLGSGIAIIALIFFAAMFGMRQLDIFGLSRQTTPTSAPPADNVLTSKLFNHMKTELPHRDEKMTIAKLAAQLGVQEYRLRRHINGTLGHRNFAAFLNGYRLVEVQSALADPTQRNVPIITIALDAGFGSLGPFNRAFRESAGMTPSEYRAQSAV